AIGVDVLRSLGRDGLAQLATLFSAFLYALAALHGRVLAHLSPLVTAASTTLLAGVCLVPAALVLEHPWTYAPSMRSMLAAGALALFCTAGGLGSFFPFVLSPGPTGVAGPG